MATVNPMRCAEFITDEDEEDLDSLETINSAYLTCAGVFSFFNHRDDMVRYYLSLRKILPIMRCEESSCNEETSHALQVGEKLLSKNKSAEVMQECSEKRSSEVKTMTADSKMSKSNVNNNNSSNETNNVKDFVSQSSKSFDSAKLKGGKKVDDKKKRDNKPSDSGNDSMTEDKTVISHARTAKEFKWTEIHSSKKDLNRCEPGKRQTQDRKNPGAGKTTARKTFMTVSSKAKVHAAVGAKCLAVPSKASSSGKRSTNVSVSTV